MFAGKISNYPQVDLLAFHREIKYSYLQRVIEITINLLTAPKKFLSVKQLIGDQKRLDRVNY